MDELSEAQIIERLDPLLQEHFPAMTAERRQSLIASLPLFLWSIYGR